MTWSGIYLFAFPALSGMYQIWQEALRYREDVEDRGCSGMDAGADNEDKNKKEKLEGRL